MNQEKLDRLAHFGAELPDGLGYADKLYFLMMRALYCTARQTKMPTEQGQREKAKIEEAIRRCRTEHEIALYRAQQMRDTGAARAEYRKARNAMGSIASLHLPPDVVAALAAADRIVEALDNIPIETGGDAVARQAQSRD